MGRMAVACCLVAFATSVSAQSNWNQFRGPDANGKSAATGLPVEWSEDSPAIRWKTPIHGKGWSSPVIWENQIWMTTATEDGSKMYAVCVDRATGKVIHDKLIFENEKLWYCHPTNSYASCTSFIEPGRIYVHFGRYGTACLDTTTAETIWTRRDFAADDFRGPASSPIVDDERLYIAFDGIDDQFVVCLDKQTGETVWRRDRDIEYDNENPDFHKAYSTAKIIEVDGQAQLISPAAVETIAYAPGTGETLWRVRHGGMNAAIPPQLDNGLLFLTAGDLGQGLFAVRPGGEGDITDTRVEWTQEKSIPSRSGLIIVDNMIFMVTGAAVATCLDATTGRKIWQQRIPGGSYWASPVYAEGNIYFPSKEGTTVVVAASPEFEMIAENQLDAGINASPAIADDLLYVRTFTHLYCLQHVEE